MDRFFYDPEFKEYAKTKPPTWYGYWYGIHFGQALKTAIGGCCRYNDQLATKLIHEFTHFDDRYWESWAVAHHNVTGYFEDEDPEIAHEAIARFFVGQISDCLPKAVRKCCGN